MTGTCDRCGGDVQNKNAAGHFRDHCLDCIEALAYSPPDDHDPDDIYAEVFDDAGN